MKRRQLLNPELLIEDCDEGNLRGRSLVLLLVRNHVVEVSAFTFCHTKGKKTGFLKAIAYWKLDWGIKKWWFSILLKVFSIVTNVL